MNYTQDRAFNPSIAGNTPGECLKNVRTGFKIPAKYPNAITASEHAQLHKDRNIPSGLYVPIYYTFGKDGHINVQLPDGTCWSDGVIYASVDDYLAKHPAVKYLGWGESINDVAVLTEGDTMTPAERQTQAEDIVTVLYKRSPQGTPTQEQATYWVPIVRDDPTGVKQLDAGLAMIETDFELVQVYTPKKK